MEEKENVEKTESIEEYMNQQKVLDTEFNRRMKGVIKFTLVVSIILYIAVVFPMMYIFDITHIIMHIVGFTALIMAVPLMTFFAGIGLVWKTKYN